MIRHFTILVFWLLTACSTLKTTGLSINEHYQQGLLEYQHSDFQRAKLSWEQGLAQTIAEKQSHTQAQFLNGLSRLAESLGNYEEAIDKAKEALAISNNLADKVLKAEALIILGQTYRELDDYAKAKDYSALAEQIANQIGDIKLQSESIRNLGATEKDQGRFESAKTAYNKSLALAEKAKDKQLQAKVINNLGELSQRLGHYQEALNLYETSLSIRVSINDVAGQSKVRGNICRLYQNLNNNEQALKYCQRAVNLAHEIGDQAHEANHLNNLAGIYVKLGKLDKAEDLIHQSILIKHQINDVSGEARSLNNLAELFRRDGHINKALEYFEKSLALQTKIGDKSGQSGTLLNIGLSYFDLGQNDSALKQLHEALLIQTELHEPDIIWQIQSKLSYVYNKSRHPWPAIFFGKLAVNTIQSVRSNNLTIDKNLKKSYLEDKRIVYEQLANLLIDQGRFLEAQQVLAMLKEEEYFDFIPRKSDGNTESETASYSKSEANYETQYRDFTERLIELGLEYTGLENRQQSAPPLSLQDQNRLEELTRYLDQTRESYTKFLEELKQVYVEENQKEDFTEKYLDKIESTKYFLTGFQNTVLLHYLYTDEKLRILLTDSNPSTRPKLYEVLISKSELNHLIFELRRKISLPDSEDASAEIQELYKYLIEPIKADLIQLKVKTLIIYPSRALRYVPFSALNDGEHYLVESYSISMYNAAAQTHMLTAERKSTWRIAAFGVSESLDPDFKDLPAVEDEIDAIVQEKTIEGSNPDKKGVLQGNKYMNADFTPAALLKSTQEKRKLKAYQVFHLATHFHLVPGENASKNSVLLAGNGEKISLENFDYKNYQMAGIDLITLSACETALGDTEDLNKDSDGKEFEGLGTLMQRKGANAVLATLWSVADKSTAEFMTHFYRLSKLKDISKSEAIHQTQLMFIKGKSNNKISDVRGVVKLPQAETSNSQYSHPYYWAPFILMGNWL